jgi:hypothetical protein
VRRLCRGQTSGGIVGHATSDLNREAAFKLADQHCREVGRVARISGTDGAIEFASAISFHVCEETGRPGKLMTNGRIIKTLAEDVGSANGYRLYTTRVGRPWLRDGKAALLAAGGVRESRRLKSQTQASSILSAVPPGFADRVETR